MRYSKKRKIVTGIIGAFCFLFIAFIIFKGIDNAKKMSEGKTDSISKPKVSASVGIVGKIKNKFKSKDDKKEEKTTKTTKVIKKESTKEDKKEEVDSNLTGTYKIVELKIGKRKYTKDEIKKLGESGYSLELTMSADNVAEIEVLYINKVYVYDNEYFDDGTNKIEYTRKGNKIKVQIDDAEMTFKKE